MTNGCSSSSVPHRPGHGLPIRRIIHLLLVSCPWCPWLEEGKGLGGHSLCAGADRILRLCQDSINGETGNISMRRHHRGGSGASAHAGIKANGAQAPDTHTLIRTFDSEANPSRPVRPSPLTASTIQGMPLDLLDRIRSFPLFNSAPDSFLTAIGSHLRPQMHSTYDYIITEGDEAKAMYWLVRGAVAVTSRDGESTYIELKPGAYFGEIGILMGIPRTATIVAQTRCLLVVLKKEDLQMELPNFPDVERDIRQEAQERLSILARKKKEGSANVKPGPKASLPTRGGKRQRDHVGEVRTGEQGTLQDGEVTQHKKRKSPSPRLAESRLTSSALGSGMVNVRSLLRELPLFSTLPPEILHFLGLNAQPMTYPPFTKIITHGSIGREVFFIVRGEVEVVDERIGSEASHRPANGFEKGSSRIKARLKQGQYFGEVASLSLAPRRTATVRSVGSVECLMINGEVLNEFWRKCPPEIRQQVESTAKERLDPANTEADIVMTDAPDTATPKIDGLEIADRTASKSSRKRDIPLVTFSQANGGSPRKTNRIDDWGASGPSDPDPFLNADLDSFRSRSRRGSLAPPSPDSASQEQQSSPGKPQTRAQTRSATSSPTKPKPKHVSTPPEQYTTPKRPRTIQRRPSQFSKGLLADDLLVRIFQNLPLHELMHLRLVSMHWRNILTNSPHVLSTLDLTPYNRVITDSVLINSICPFIGARPTEIDISNCFHIGDEGFSALAAACASSTRAWRMKSVWDITAQAILEMANKAKNLEEIDLSNCRKVSDNLLARVVGWVVQELPPPAQPYHPHHQRHPSKAPSSALLPAPPGTVIGCPRLRKLTLSYCKHVTDRSMAHLAVHASSRLEEVDLTRCTTITDQGFQHWSIYQFSALRKLCLADCTYLTDNAIVYLTSAAKGLRELDLVSVLTPFVFDLS